MVTTPTTPLSPSSIYGSTDDSSDSSSDDGVLVFQSPKPIKGKHQISSRVLENVGTLDGKKKKHHHHHHHHEKSSPKKKDKKEKHRERNHSTSTSNSTGAGTETDSPRKKKSRKKGDKQEKTEHHRRKSISNDKNNDQTNGKELASSENNASSNSPKRHKHRRNSIVHHEEEKKEDERNKSQEKHRHHRRKSVTHDGETKETKGRTNRKDKTNNKDATKHKNPSNNDKAKKKGKHEDNDNNSPKHQQKASKQEGDERNESSLTIERDNAPQPAHNTAALPAAPLVRSNSGNEENDGNKQGCNGNNDSGAPLKPIKIAATRPDSKNRKSKTVNASSKKKDLWYEYGGLVLEPSLESGAIALLDSEWICQYSHDRQQEKQKHDEINSKSTTSIQLPHRQDLPSEALLSLSEIQQRTKRFHLGIIVVTSNDMSWLHPNHPDPPNSQTLELLVQALKSRFIHEQRRNHKEQSGTDDEKDIDTDDNDDEKNIYADDDDFDDDDLHKYAIFWNCASLHQDPRTDSESTLFQEGLAALPSFYSHPRTICFQLTQLFEDDPNGYDNRFEQDTTTALCAANHAMSFVERCWVSTRDTRLTFDISTKQQQQAENNSRTITTHAQSHMAPLTPARLAEIVQQLKSNNDKRDLAVVMDLYQKEFQQYFAGKEFMAYNDMDWGDKAVTHVSEIIGEHCPKLAAIELKGNCFSVAGCQALSLACQHPNKNSLVSINLQGNEMIGDKGLDILCHLVFRQDSSLLFLGMDQCGISDLGCATLSCDIVAYDAALRKRKEKEWSVTDIVSRFSSKKEIHIGLDCNPITRQGDEWLDKALSQCLTADCVHIDRAQDRLKLLL